MGEWLRSLTDTDIGGMADALTEVTVQAWSMGWGPDLDGTGPADPLVLDVDGTLTQTYGANKDGTGARNYQGVRGYAPLLAVEASTGQVIAARLRVGNASPANGAVGFPSDRGGLLFDG